MSYLQMRQNESGELSVLDELRRQIVHHQSRLDLQHRLIFESCDRKLILAPVSLKEGNRVLEVGAGTGQYYSSLVLGSQLPDKSNQVFGPWIY